ncbi:DNA-binding protein WhiA [Pseudonocardia sp. EV170527-09]|uniref:DNA-binding protein WhiA n=1 Tax=Pseudonocardia sp. EV170527-09 TaxID=2603411 RepID=UPI001386AAD2|nr:DNA-binding protein WhiA [Pseudonocardia sp. EV170527-09]
MDTPDVRDELFRHRPARADIGRAEVATTLRFVCAGTLGQTVGVASVPVLEVPTGCARSAERLARQITDLFEIPVVRPSAESLRIVARVPELARRTRLCDGTGRWVRGLPPSVVAGDDAVLAGAWRAAFLAAGALGGRGRAGLELICPSPETAMALTGAARRLGVAALTRPSTHGDRVVVRDHADVRVVLSLIGAPRAAQAWTPDLRRGTGEAPVSGALHDANRERASQAAATTTRRVQALLADPPAGVPDRLLATGLLRARNPELSLQELGRLADPPMTKDAIAGRLRRLLEHADRAHPGG